MWDFGIRPHRSYTNGGDLYGVGIPDTENRPIPKDCPHSRHKAISVIRVPTPSRTLYNKNTLDKHRFSAVVSFYCFGVKRIIPKIMPMNTAPKQGREEMLNSVAQTAMDISKEIRGVAIVDADGLPLALNIPEQVDEGHLGAMVATLLGAAEQMSTQLMGVPLEQTFVKSETGYVILNAIGETAVIALLATDKVKLGLVFFELKRIISRLEQILGSK